MMFEIYVDRLKRSFKKNGPYKTLLTLPKKASLILEDLQNIKRNKTIYNIMAKHTRIIPYQYMSIGGYTIKDHNKKDDTNKVALCFGIYDEVQTELSLVDKGYKVYAFDPTPISVDLFRNNTKLNKLIHYKPWAVWSEDKKMKFFYKEDDQSFDNFEGTLEDIDHSNQYETVDAFSLKTIMEKFDLSIVDYIKMDVEGAVPEVLIAYFNSESDERKFPYEIVFELEMPKDFRMKKAIEILGKIDVLLDTLNKYYNVYNIPNDKASKNMHIHATRFDKDI